MSSEEEKVQFLPYELESSLHLKFVEITVLKLQIVKQLLTTIQL